MAVNNIDDEKLGILVQKENLFFDLRNKRVKGVRSRNRYEDFGEKPSTIFVNFDNGNYNYKVINKLVNEKGGFYETEYILGCQKDFEQNLYFNHTMKHH